MWLRNFRIRKLQTFMMMLIVFLCALLTAASASILLLLDKPFHELAEECESPQAAIYPYFRTDEEIEYLAEQLEVLDEIDEVVLMPQHYLNEEFRVKEKKIESFCNLVEYNDRVHEKIRFVEGGESGTIKEGECYLPACICNKYDIGIGDTLVIGMAYGDETYLVSGIYADPYSTSLAFDSQILVKELPKEMSTTFGVRIYCDEGVGMNQIAKTYEEKYGSIFPGELNAVEDSIDNSILAVRILGAILLAIGMIMLIVSCLIINFIVRNAMIADAKTIAIYKTMGYGTGDILKMYLMFYFVTASVSSIVGIWVSKIFSKNILMEMFRNIGAKTEVHVFFIGIPCYIAIVGMLLLTVFLVIRRTRRVKPIYALNGMNHSGSKKQKNYRADYQGSFSAFGIAMRMMFRNKKGLIGILVTAVVSIVGMNFAVISLDVAEGMKENNDYWLGVDKSDIMISLSDNVGYEEVKELIAKESRIEKMVPCSFNGYNGLLILDAKNEDDIREVYPFVYGNYDDVEMDIYEGRHPVSGKEIAISGKIAEQMKKNLGDYLNVTINGVDKSFLITGLYQTYYSMGKNCRITPEAYEGTGISFAYDSLSVYLEPEADTEQMIDRIQNLIGGKGKVIPRTEQFASIMELIASPQETAIPPSAALMLFISGANVFCIVLLKNAKEEKMNGIYKCIGYSTGHLIMATVIYIAILAAVTIAVAVPIVLVLYPEIMKLCLGMFGLLEYDVSYNVSHLIAANGAVFLSFVLCTLLSARSLKKVDVRNLICE